jgi:repressor LexA
MNRMSDLIKALLAARAWNQAELAERLGTAQTTVSRWMAGAEPRGDTRDAIRALARESGIDLSPDHRLLVPIMGYVGAGAAVEPDFEQVPAEGLDQVSIPYAVDRDFIAFRVGGDSMMPKYDDGEILIVERVQPSSIESMIGRMAVVRTEDGRRLVKRIAPGPKHGAFNLESINARTIEDVRIMWASPIKMIIANPRAQNTERKPRRRRTRT